MRPWDPCNDLVQYESGYVIKARTRHRTPMVRARSLSSLDKKDDCKAYNKNKLCGSRIKRPSLNHRHIGDESGSSTPDLEINRQDSDSSGSAGKFGFFFCQSLLGASKSYPSLYWC